ncbi:MAG: transposase [bacterium]
MKPKRFNTPGTTHALSFRCYRNLKFLNNDRTRKYLADSINAARIKYNFDVIAWAFMPNHVHLIIHPRDENYSISKILHAIKMPVAKKAITYLKRRNPGILKFMETGNESSRWRFWQNGGGYDRNIRNEKELFNTINYIHDNPVRKGLVKKQEDWAYSSAREWLTEEKGIIEIDRLIEWDSNVKLP